MIPNILYLDPNGKLDDKIRNIQSKYEYIDVRPHLAIFDGVAVPKEMDTETTVIRMTERERRLVLFENETDQNYLAMKNLIRGYYSSSEQSLQESAFLMVDAFADNKDNGCGRNLILPKRFFHGRDKSALGIKIQFLDGLTIAPQNINLEDLLKFKEKNKELYNEFWSYLTNTVDSIRLGEDNDTNIVNGFISVANEYEEAARNTWGRRVCNSFSIDFELGTNVEDWIAVIAAQQYMELHPVLLMAPVLGAIKISGCLTPRREKISEGARAMAYAYKVKKLV